MVLPRQATLPLGRTRSFLASSEARPRRSEPAMGNIICTRRERYFSR